MFIEFKSMFLHFRSSETAAGFAAAKTFSSRSLFYKHLAPSEPGNLRHLTDYLFSFDFFQRCHTAFTHGRISLRFADMNRIVPTTFALCALRTLNHNLDQRYRPRGNPILRSQVCLKQLCLGNDKNVTQLIVILVRL